MNDPRRDLIESAIIRGYNLTTYITDLQGKTSITMWKNGQPLNGIIEISIDELEQWYPEVANILTFKWDKTMDDIRSIENDINNIIRNNIK